MLAKMCFPAGGSSIVAGYAGAGGSNAIDSSTIGDFAQFSVAGDATASAIVAPVHHSDTMLIVQPAYAAHDVSHASAIGDDRIDGLSTY